MNFFKKIWRPLLAFTLIAILIKKGPFQPEQLKVALSNPTLIILGMLLIFTQLLLASFRWKLFVDLLSRTSFAKIFKLTLVGTFFNYFIPGGVGGDIVKALELSQKNNRSRSECLSTVMSDRIFGLFAMISFTFIFLSIEYFTHQQVFLLKFLMMSGLLLASIILALLFLPSIFKKISGHLSTKEHPILIKIEKLISSLHFTFITFKDLKIQVKSFLLSLFLQIFGVYFMYYVISALGVAQPSFLIFFSLSCFVFVASAIPIFPAGIGVGQVATYAMFSHISEDLAKATVTAITIFQLFNFIYALIGGAIFSFMPKNIKKEIEV